MTVSLQTPINQHTANGVTTVFAYTFKILDSDDLSVYLDGVESTSGFTVAGVGGESGGTVTFSTAPASGVIVSLIRDMGLIRETDYQNSGDFLSETVNTDFDRIWMAIQQQNRILERRALLFPDTEVRTSSQNALPSPVAGTIPQWQADGSLGYVAISSVGSDLSFVNAEPIYASLAALVASSEDADAVQTASAISGAGKGGAKFYRNGTGTATTPGNEFTDLANNGVVYNTVGVGYSLRIDQMITPWTFGGVCDGVPSTTDATALQLAVGAVFDGTSKGRAVIIPKECAAVIDETVEVPPNVWLVGEALYSTNVTGSRIMVSHNGIGVRFVRRNASAGSLWHMGGAYKVAFSTTAGGGSSTVLVELGDSTDVATDTGCWKPTIRDCVFSYAPTGYGIYSAHSQEALIDNNLFRNVKYPVYYNTVMASAKIINNDFLDESAISGAVAIFMRQGTLGGSSGATILGNYSIGFDTFLWGVSIHGVCAYSNQIEGVRKNGIYLTRYLLNESTQDGDGCYGWDVTGNTFINFAAAGGGHAAIQLSYSHDNEIGKNTYQSPNASAGSCVGWYDGGSGDTRDNVIRYPVVTGSNTSVLPIPAASAVSLQNMIISPSFVQTKPQAKSSLPSATYKGRMIYVDDEAGGATLAFSDGTNWRRVQDRAIVS